VATPINVELVAPDRIVWEGEADMVIARTTDGELGVMANHIPLLGVLVDHPVRIRRDGQDVKTVNVRGGFLSVTKEKVSILAESVEDAPAEDR
jgi:F-type H+-transporting ATPase subunit epsilon